MVAMSEFSRTIMKKKYAHVVGERKEEWSEIAERVVTSVMSGFMPKLVAKVTRLVEQRKFMPGGRYLYAAGLPYPQVNNCFLFRAEDSRDGWGDIMNKTTKSLMTGGGIGVVYSKLRNEGAYIRGMGGTSTGPCSLMQMVNESGRHIMQGGSRRAALWAGLHWAHPDVFKFATIKNWSPEVAALKAKDYNFPATMDGTNISIQLDRDFFDAMADPNWSKTYMCWGSPHTVNRQWAQRVYALGIRQMCTTAEPGFSVDMMDPDEYGFLSDLRNACTEVDSRDDSDCCNLASINMARYDSLSELEEDLPYMTAFLLCGTLYSKMPLDEMYRVRDKNRRIGLGLMGVHEWLVSRGCRYGDMTLLRPWLESYSTLARSSSDELADRLGIARPIACRSIAPTGTISIVAETTSGIEPLFAVAYKRRYLKDSAKHCYQYVVDATAGRLIREKAVDPALIEDAHDLAEDVERRIKFQADLQDFVDQGISSTINLPKWGTSVNNEDTLKSFGDTLFRYLPRLRGVTAYPDGCRDGQPLERASYREAMEKLGVEIEETYEHSDAAKPDGCKAGMCAS